MSSRVYVGKISRDVRERDLERFFQSAGEVRSVTIKNGFAFVEFRDYRDAEDAVHDLHGKEFFGERIVCELARGERRRALPRDKYGPMQRTQYRCVVENLASNVSWQDLKDFMRKAGEVTYADCHKEREGEGVVEFSSKDDLREALRRLDDQDLKGRRVVLREVKGDVRDGSPPRDSREHRDSGRDRRDRDRRYDDRRRSPSPRGRSPPRRRSRSPRRRSPSPKHRRADSREGDRRRGSSPRDLERARARED